MCIELNKQVIKSDEDLTQTGKDERCKTVTKIVLMFLLITVTMFG